MEQPTSARGQEMPAYHKFKDIVYRKLRLLGLCLGLDVLQPDYRPNFMTIITVLAGISAISLFTMTALFGEGDLAVTADACIRLALKVIIKCIFMLLARKQLIESMAFITRVYEKNRSNHHTRPVFNTFVNTFSVCFNALCIVYVIAFITAPFTPFIIFMVIYFVWDERILIYPMMIPGTSLDIDDHYELNMLLQLFFVHLNGLSYMYFDAIFVIQLLHVILMANLVCDQIRKTGKLLTVKQPSQANISTNLCRIIQLQCELRDFVQMIQQLYYYPLAIIFAVALQSIGSKILLILNMGYHVTITIPLMAMVELCELGYLCAMGSLVDYCNERIFAELNNFEWYLLPLKEQKAYLLMLLASNKARNLNVANVVPLNVNIYLIVLHRMYSFALINTM